MVKPSSRWKPTSLSARNNQKIKTPPVHWRPKIESVSDRASSLRENQQTRPCVVSVWTRWQRAEERRGEPDPPGTGSGLRWDNKSGFCCRLQPQLHVFSSQIFLFLLLLLYLNRMERRVHGVQRRSPLPRPRALLTGRSVKRTLLQINLSSLHLRPLVVRLNHSTGVTFPQTAILKLVSKEKEPWKQD